jgi:hypothetical protein
MQRLARPVVLLKDEQDRAELKTSFLIGRRSIGAAWLPGLS